MNREHWEKVESLYLQAMDLPVSERESFVLAQCGDDDTLRDDVLRLLRAGEPGSDFIQPPTLPVASAFDNPPLAKFGEFEVLEEIGRGGMGVVYRGWQASLGRTIAIKVLPPATGLSQRSVDRFLREARAVAKLSHPGIVSIHSVGTQESTRYFVMEYVEGCNLAEEIERIRRGEAPVGQGSRFPDSRDSSYFRRVAEVVMAAAEALQHAHENGIVHRDIKPSNLLLGRGGRVKIVDFGLARDEAEGSLSRDGEVAGTLCYMSPEQLRARKDLVDHRTDIYSLGVVLFELLTLRRPFDGETSSDVVKGILEREPPPVRRLNERVPRDLATICLEAMSKEAGRRYPDACAFADDLRRFLEHQAIHARAPSLSERGLRFARRHARAIGVVVLLLFCMWLASIWIAASNRWARIDAHWAAIDGALGTQRLDDLPLSVQVDLRGRLAALQTEGVEDTRIAALQATFRELRASLLQRGQALLDASRDPDLAVGDRETQRLSGMQILLRASFLFPGDTEILSLSSIESAMPTVELQMVDENGNPVEGDVWLREVDAFTSGVGPARSLGRGPMVTQPLAPGFYRISVAFAGGGLTEFPIAAGTEAMTIRLQAVARPSVRAVPADWVSFDACDYTFPDYPGERCYQGRTVHIAAFHASPYEASNRQYHAFLAATARQRPQSWRSIADVDAFLNEYGDLPVVGISWDDGDAFARWMGARLPTSAEWFRMATGLEGRSLPYVTQQPTTDLRGNIFGDQVQRGSPEPSWQLYLRSAARVDSHPEARTPEGIHHMFGNVAEFVESVSVIRTAQDRLVPQFWHRFRFGSTWAAVADNESMLTPAFVGTGTSFARPYLGVRLVRSADP